MSLALFPRHVPEPPAGIDLRCCGASELLDSLDDGIADLVVLDPPPPAAVDVLAAAGVHAAEQRRPRARGSHWWWTAYRQAQHGEPEAPPCPHCQYFGGEEHHPACVWWDTDCTADPFVAPCDGGRHG